MQSLSLTRFQMEDSGSKVGTKKSTIVVSNLPSARLFLLLLVYSVPAKEGSG
jgi:hypothetical protein